LQPNHLDHKSSKVVVNSPLVNLGLVFNHSINFVISSKSIVSFTSLILLYVFNC
jgi:hypothetical protein